MKGMKIALYARVSSEKQAQDKTINSQIEAIKSYIQESGGEVDPDLIFCDDGMSGATLIRPALEALRDSAFSGKMDKICILSPDRLARKYAHQLLLVEEFNKLNIEIIFINKAISQTPEDQMLLQIQGVISEYEREKITERCRRGKLHAAKNGNVNALGGAPFGYVYMKANQGQNAYYKIHPIEAEIVRECYDLYCHKQVSIGAICRLFKEKGYITRTGKTSWACPVIWGMLQNPAYKGEAAFRKTIMVEREKITKKARDGSLYPKLAKSSCRQRPKEDRITIPVPKIIDPSLFERAEERLKESKKFSPRNNKKYEYLVSGLIRCDQCGYAMYGMAATTLNTKRFYYRCSGQDGRRWPNGKHCSGNSVRIEVIDELVWNATKRLISSPEIVMNEYANRMEKMENKAVSNEQICHKKMQELKHAQREKERILDLYQLGTVALDEIQPRLQGIRTKIERINQELDLLKRDEELEAKRLYVIQRFEDFCSTIATNLEELPFADRKKILRLLVTEITVNKSKGEISVNHILPLEKNSFRLCSRTRKGPFSKIPIYRSLKSGTKTGSAI
jgi:site-specific DNA recombinase